MTALPRLKDLENKSFDPFVVEKLFTGDTDDPYPVIQDMLRRGTVHKGGYRDLFAAVPDQEFGETNQYSIYGYDTLQRVMNDTETFTSKEAYDYSLGQSFGRTVSAMDPPEHTRYRRIFQKAFLPQIVAKWGESVVDGVINDLMSKFEGRGSADLVEEFTHYYPFQVVYRQLKMDAEQGPIFHKLAISQLMSVVGAPEAREATRNLGEFFQALIDYRRANPSEDLVTYLAMAEADGEKLPDEVVISFLRQLMNAGGDTTFRGLTCLLVGLLTHPDQFAAVKADRSLVPQAIDEALRWEGPVPRMYRYAMRDAEVDGVAIPKGAIVNIVLASGSRDPSKYANPDAFDIFRERSVRHLAFSGGPHVCIGQHLARVEMNRGLNAIFDRLPNLRLDPDRPPPDIRGHELRVADHLYVKFDPA